MHLAAMQREEGRSGLCVTQTMVRPVLSLSPHVVSMKCALSLLCCCKIAWYENRQVHDEPRFHLNDAALLGCSDATKFKVLINRAHKKQ